MRTRPSRRGTGRWTRIVAFSAVAFGACALLERTQAAVPTRIVPAQSGDHHRMVIVLPGRGDNLDVVERSNVASAIQQSMPDADVVLAGMTLAYYREGRSVQRLHDQYVEPARQRGYRDIYLAGASMGGMGALLYEGAYPGELAGLILLAPYMGDASLIDEIRAAGGLQRWNPGPVPAELNSDNVPREEWRTVQAWLGNPERARHVWLVCGRSDGFFAAAELLAGLLPADHFIPVDGGHAWTVWVAGAKIAFARVASAAH